jgi:hypothetical protein
MMPISVKKNGTNMEWVNGCCYNVIIKIKTNYLLLIILKNLSTQ